ncbi:MAG: radical SAM protein [Muribaculaceae bacterium]|nr:radical SAM protein [Muribaculaceae bacterium]
MLDRESIINLYDSGAPFRELSFDQVLSNFARYGDLFFAWLSADEPQLIEKAARELWFLNTGLPVENLSGHPREDSKGDGDYKVFADMGKLYADFKRILGATLPAHADPDRLLRDLYLFFPGIRRYLEENYNVERLSFPINSRLRQLMVFVCGQCNLHCPYCFSHDLVRKEISPSDLEKIFSWAAGQGCQTVTPCGGEPLLYSSLELFLDLVARYDMTTYLASNCTIDIQRIKGFTADIVKRLYVHFTSETLADARFRRTFFDNIRYCKENRIDMTARVNLISPDADKALKWIDLTKDSGIKRLNIALTIPSRYKGNRFTSPDHFKVYIPTICRMVNHAEELGIALGIAKPLPMCLFPDDIATKLMRADANMALCGIHQSGYMNNLSISTDMAFSPCLGLTDVRVPFDPSIKWQDLEAAFVPGLKTLLDRNLKEECDLCFLKERGLCQGSCLSYKYNHDEDFKQ